MAHASTLDAGRRRVLLMAYACHPEASMETRLAWKRVELASDQHHVTVVCGPNYSQAELDAFAERRGLAGKVSFHPVENDRRGKTLMKSGLFWYQGYGHWQKRAFAVAEQLHAQQPFALVHQVNYCGYREPGSSWQLGVPFVWGPVGGTQYFPWRFLRYAGLVGGARELTRNAMNFLQLRYSRRVRNASRHASLVVAATRQAQRDLARCQGVDAPVELETGLDCPIAPPRDPREPNRPLRLLLAGRLQPWKAASLLINAIADLPEDVEVEVRVLGDGPCRDRWRQLAERRGVANRFCFVPWVAYHETLPHYRWADVLAFTSLRDTSGTGLLEALASGAPILGLDHQGAADVMTDACAIKIPVDSPRQVIAGFRDGIIRLSRDPDLWLRMSRAARSRAEDFCWQPRQAITNTWYANAIGDAVRSTPVSPRKGANLFTHKRDLATNGSA